MCETTRSVQKTQISKLDASLQPSANDDTVEISTTPTFGATQATSCLHFPRERYDELPPHHHHHTLFQSVTDTPKHNYKLAHSFIIHSVQLQYHIVL